MRMNLDLLEFFQEIIYLKKIKDGAYVINLDEMQILVHIGLLYFFKKNEIIYFDSFGVEHILEETKKFIGNKNIKANIFLCTSK